MPPLTPPSQKRKGSNVHDGRQRRCGDDGLFCNDYTKLREYFSINESIEAALANQDLLEEYLELAVA